MCVYKIKYILNIQTKLTSYICIECGQHMYMRIKEKHPIKA